MPTSSVNRVIQHLCHALATDGRSDGQLLGCFVKHRDKDAFAALVRRHSPMVWGVCRRLLDHHDAEDATQAAFLVLVHKAANVVPREMVANWLYGVAHQIALLARRTAARRKTREKQVTQMSESGAAEQDLWHDLQYNLKRFQEARADFTEAIRLNSNQSACYLHRGLAHAVEDYKNGKKQPAPE